MAAIAVRKAGMNIQSDVPSVEIEQIKPGDFFEYGGDFCMRLDSKTTINAVNLLTHKTMSVDWAALVRPAEMRIDRAGQGERAGTETGSLSVRWAAGIACLPSCTLTGDWYDKSRRRRYIRCGAT